MSHEDLKSASARRTASLPYELRMTLHALATDLVDGAVDPLRVESRLRSVITLGKSVLDHRIPLPRRPFDFSEESRPIGPGALLYEYAEAGATGLGDVLSELDEGLLAELDQLVTRADQVPAGSELPKAAPVSGVPLLLAPVDDWHVIARADIRFDPGAAGRSWAPLPDPAAIERGLRAARHLVSGVGSRLSPEVRPQVNVRDLLAPSAIGPDCCALAVALSWVAAEGDLPGLGDLGVLALAGISPDGDWLPPAVSERAMAAATEAGLGVLSREADGWRLCRAGTVETDTEPTLLGAVRLLWADQWQATVRRWAAQTLAEQEWRVLHSTGAADSAPGWSGPADRRLVEFDRASFLFKRFHGKPLSRVIQSGARNCGKTVCAQQLVRKLEGAGWQTVVVSPDRHQLPSDGELPVVIRAALTTTGVDSSRRKVLVVLEDLHALEDGNVGEALESLGELKVGVLALTRFVDGAANRWDNHGVTSYVTLVAPEDVPDLARRMIAQAPGEYRVRADDTAAVDLAVEACQGDLRLLGDLLREEPADTPTPAAALPERGQGAELVRARARSVCDGLGTDARAAVALLAAVSWLDEGLPSAHLAAVPEHTRASLAVVVHEDLARIPSTVRAEAVLACASPKGLDALPGHLEPYVVTLLGEGNHQRLYALLRKCAAYAPEHLARLLEIPAVRRAITDWAATAHPRQALTLLRLCRRNSDGHWTAAALPAVIERIPQTHDLTVRDLTLALTSLWDDELRLPQNVLSDLVAWVGTPQEGLDSVLARSSTLPDRFNLVSALLQLAGEGTTPTGTVCEWLEQRADDLVRGADPARHRDLIAVRRMDDLIFTKSRQARRDDAPSALRPLVKQAQYLIDSPPTRDRSLAAILAWLSLRLHFDGAGDWDQIIEQYKSQLQAALAYSDASQISLALSDLAQSNRGLSNRLLNHLKFGRTLVPVVKAAPPAEAAILISTVRNIHAATLRTLLYRENRDGDLIADSGLARELAKSVCAFEDARGAGMLLSSVSRVDDLYCDTKERFGYRLASELGQEFVERVIRRERRPAIVYHLLRGLWESGADYRQAVEESALNLVVSSIHAQRGTARPWGPRLAMLLIQDEYFGQHFLHELAARLDRRVLRDRMAQLSLDPESMVHTHRLGLALVPDIGADFAKLIELDKAGEVQLLSTARNVAQKLQVLADTLRAGGVAEATELVLKHFRQQNPHWSWAERLRVRRGIGAFTTTLGQLRKLDPSEAATTVDTLSRPHGGQDLSHLRDLVLRSVVHPPLAAELLSEVERCRTGLGKAELAALRGERRRWRTLIEVFKFEQDPLTQGVVGRHLARLGVTNRTEETEWMHTLVTTRWEGTMHLLASPRAVSELLTLAFMWEPQWGEQLAASVNVDRLLNRLRLGLRSDLQDVPRLLEALWLTGHRDAFDVVLGHVRGLPVDVLANALGLRQASRLLQVIHVAKRSADALPEAVGRLVEQVAGRPLVVDAEAHWAGLGWAAQALHECSGLRFLPEVVPALRPNTVAYPAAVAWAAAWLPRTEWSSAIVSEAVDAFEKSGSNQHWHPRETCMTLIAAARAGLLPADGPLDPQWYAATEASPHLLTLLFREAEVSPFLRAHLARPEIATRMRKVISAPGLSSHLCKKELSSAVERLCPEPPTPGPGPNKGLGL
ncbi:hypothetical protein ACF1AY_21450 [Streptomyces sp. NPDC014776]|uniref:hypothetical protein n=1 Tax=Streptomyces sp. NPDC014776 TaxID=3364909 RepID=UPI0037028BCA